MNLFNTMFHTTAINFVHIGTCFLNAAYSCYQLCMYITWTCFVMLYTTCLTQCCSILLLFSLYIQVLTSPCCMTLLSILYTNKDASHNANLLHIMMHTSSITCLFHKICIPFAINLVLTHTCFIKLHHTAINLVLQLASSCCIQLLSMLYIYLPVSQNMLTIAINLVHTHTCFIKLHHTAIILVLQKLASSCCKQLLSMLYIYLPVSQNMHTIAINLVLTHTCFVMLHTTAINLVYTGTCYQYCTYSYLLCYAAYHCYQSWK